MAPPLLIPQPLKPGDRIAIVSPAGIARPQNVYGAMRALERRGWNPYVAPHALGRHGSFSATADERLADFAEALLDPSVRAILCSRGGYGAIHLLDGLDRLPLRDNAKWLIGFSDISALHALFARHGVASIHSSMTKRLAQTGGDDPQSSALFGLLQGARMSHTFAAHPLNRPGNARGRLAGGNLAVLSALISTRFDLLQPGTLLFIEDIAEPVYKVERILTQLRLSGVLERLSGLIVGQFTNYNPDVNHASMEAMIHRAVSGYSYPVAFGAPIGHIDENIPLVEGIEAELDVAAQSSISATTGR